MVRPLVLKMVRPWYLLSFKEGSQQHITTNICNTFTTMSEIYANVCGNTGGLIMFPAPMYTQGLWCTPHTAAPFVLFMLPGMVVLLLFVMMFIMMIVVVVVAVVVMMAP